MKTRSESDDMNTLGVFIKYFSAFMSLTYIAAGIFLLLKGNTSFSIPGRYSVSLGIILTLYGAFRGYRVYKKYFEAQHESDD